jgi:hypothetical protein
MLDCLISRIIKFQMTASILILLLLWGLDLSRLQNGGRRRSNQWVSFGGTGEFDLEFGGRHDRKKSKYSPKAYVIHTKQFRGGHYSKTHD